MLDTLLRRTDAGSLPHKSSHISWPGEREMRFIHYWAKELETYSAPQILRWAAEMYTPRLAVVTSFGLSASVFAAMLSENELEVPFCHIDTGYHFQETHDLRERLEERYAIKVESHSPEQSVEEYEAANGPLYTTNPARCCHERKFGVLRKLAPRYNAWICGARREQSRSHAGLPIIEWDERFGLVRIAPLARWTKQSLWEKVQREEIPYNNLFEQGHSKITCLPCAFSEFDEGEKGHFSRLYHF